MEIDFEASAAEPRVSAHDVFPFLDWLEAFMFTSNDEAG